MKTIINSVNIRLLFIVSLLIFATSVNAQSITEKQKVAIDQTITYLKRLSLVSSEWTNHPEKKEYRKEMEDLVKSYDKIKENVTPVFIFIVSEEDRSTLKELLNNYASDKDQLVMQLLVWKYQPQRVSIMDMLYQLDEIHEASKEVLSILKNDKSEDDALSVLLSQDGVENKLVPLSKSLIDQLTTLESIK